MSGGWDSRVKFWTWQGPTQLNQIGEAYLGKPIHYMSGEFPLLVTAHSELFIHYWDLRIFSTITLALWDRLYLLLDVQQQAFNVLLTERDMRSVQSREDAP